MTINNDDNKHQTVGVSKHFLYTDYKFIALSCLKLLYMMIADVKIAFIDQYKLFAVISVHLLKIVC